MNMQVRNSAGTLLLLNVLPVLAQSTASSAASTSVDCKPCVSTPAQIIPPGGPTWLMVVIALVVGLGLGYFFGWRSAGQSRQ